MHDSPTHRVPAWYLLQPPAPSHRPSVPHDDAPWSLHILRASEVPAGIDVHVPADPASAQLRHAPPQAWLQQTPSTQNPDAHSDACEQAPPFCFGPQLFFTQAIPGAQSAFVLHFVLQAPCEHPKGEQSLRPGAWHMPIPSQVPAVFNRAPAQDGGTQTVSASYLLHPPNPSHVPVWPQLPAPLSLQTLRGSGTPPGSGKQMPSLPTIPHETQPPVHATAQQKPSTQNPDAH